MMARKHMMQRWTSSFWLTREFLWAFLFWRELNLPGEKRCSYDVVVPTPTLKYVKYAELCLFICFSLTLTLKQVMIKWTRAPNRYAHRCMCYDRNTAASDHQAQMSENVCGEQVHSSCAQKLFSWFQWTWVWFKPQHCCADSNVFNCHLLSSVFQNSDNKAN